ncbi:glutamine--fructose-6-phosphate transaminase (isomerizing) [Treponema ruminis]|uniref:Glutamine--fructose-6-phosphate aminotransferase [isomerizing] n=1 Tax=Treponema ruminis TaxID=744515 RepID=A0A7W8GBN9_9SPIR|nr:glutamine--fructose-6-phosphate transaminase (isomerizing) [Treponema ruminis]MBB5227264.1 glucosamine--fructose-6-phosphate aminotransferase (isomerizing) [Treponema ruminis]QSI01507.1 glutamine--fructose-6-phosphate transaminase (isomerizing) [Treponema ruminis]
MCGIVGYVGSKQVTPVLINGLKKLEYRGYDSAGVAVMSDSSDEILVKKSKGALKFLVEKITDEVVKTSKDMSDAQAEKRLGELIEKTGTIIKGNVGIGHTRWATHGEPSDLNSHPHTNVSGTIAVVHNGIIENYAKLKAWLQDQGVVFKSQTDTEVIAHLINYFYEKTGEIFKAVLETLHRLEGSYALGVLCTKYPDRLIAARKESPLIVGLGRGENFIASDVPAVLEYTRDVYYLNQNELAVLYNDHVDLFDSDGNKVVREPSHVEWDMASAEKGGYAHFMLKEIHEQPKALTDTLRPRLIFDGDKAKDIQFDEIDFGEDWKQAGRIVITACGTAYHAGVVAKYAFEKFARIPVAVDVASEFRYRNPILNKNDIFIVISQSGETADTLAALRLAKAAGAKVIAITNCVGSTVSREADEVIYTWAGPEIAVASTKAYTTQLMCLYLLAIKLGKERGSLSAQQYSRLLSEIAAIPEKAQQILDNQSEIQKFASQQFNKSKIFYIGRLFDSASSLESALKLKEVSYMHCEAFAAGELKHGPIALVDPDTLVVAIATEPELYEKLASNIVEVKSRGATTMAITLDKKGAFDNCCDSVITIPDSEPALASMLSIIPAQLFAYYCSILRGNDPDKPRNLAKSVTVE